MKEEYLPPAKIYFRTKPVVYTTILGSCISVIIELKNKSAYSGICHYLNSSSGLTNESDFSYGDNAIKNLLSRFLNKGIKESELQARLFGGANVTGDKDTGRDVCRENIRIAKQILNESNIKIVEEDTGGKLGRKIIYSSEDKKTIVQTQNPTASKEIQDLFKFIYKWTSNDPYEKPSYYYFELLRFKRLNELNSFSELITKLQEEKKLKLNFINQVTNHSTEWFRHEEVYNHCVKNLPLNTDDIKILSAGCSVGKEAYSIAMALKLSGLDAFKIQGIDIDSLSVDKANLAEYPTRDFKDIPEHYKRFFLLKNQKLHISDDIKRRVDFFTDNILSPLNLTGKFDAIFCQNVLIYFSEKDVLKIIDSFAFVLKKGGYLYLNRKENLLHKKFENIGNGILRKI